MHEPFGCLARLLECVTLTRVSLPFLGRHWRDGCVIQTLRQGGIAKSYRSDCLANYGTFYRNLGHGFGSKLIDHNEHGGGSGGRWWVNSSGSHSDHHGCKHRNGGYLHARFIGTYRTKNEFRRAFAAACLHDWFNLLAVAILFPLELATGILSRLATVLSDVFANAGGLQLANPLKVMTEPAVATLSTLVGGQPILLLLLSVALMVGMLICLVKLLRILIEARIKAMLDDYIFRNAATAMGVGLVFTLLVQSSSVTTSLMIPLAATGVLSLAQVFPYVIGANFGTTCTAMLAAMATGNPAAVTVAFAHFLFNISGALCIWPWPKVRAIPVRLAEWLADKAMENRLVPIVFILVVFVIVPLIFTWGRFREAFAG